MFVFLKVLKYQQVQVLKSRLLLIVITCPGFHRGYLFILIFSPNIPEQTGRYVSIGRICEGTMLNENAKDYETVSAWEKGILLLMLWLQCCLNRKCTLRFQRKLKEGKTTTNNSDMMSLCGEALLSGFCCITSHLNCQYKQTGMRWTNLKPENARNAQFKV